MFNVLFHHFYDMELTNLDIKVLNRDRLCLSHLREYTFPDNLQNTLNQLGL